MRETIFKHLPTIRDILEALGSTQKIQFLDGSVIPGKAKKGKLSLHDLQTLSVAGRYVGRRGKGGGYI